MLITRAVAEKESGTRFMSKGKDIKNLQKAEARKRGVDEEDLHTLGKVQKRKLTQALCMENCNVRRRLVKLKQENRLQVCRRLKSPLFSGAKAEEKEEGERDSLKRTLGR